MKLGRCESFCVAHVIHKSEKRWNTKWNSNLRFLRKEKLPRVSRPENLFSQLRCQEKVSHLVALLFTNKWLHLTGGHKLLIVRSKAHATLPLPTRDEGTFIRSSARRYNGDGVVRPWARQSSGEYESTGQQSTKWSGWKSCDCRKGKAELVGNAASDSSNFKVFLMISFDYFQAQNFLLSCFRVWPPRTKKN